MLIFPNENEDEIFIDIYLTEDDMDALKGKQMLSEEMSDFLKKGKPIYIGILNTHFRTGPSELPEQEEDE